MIHRVRQGECVSSIAARYGFESWRSIYEHPSNADLRKARPSPDLLYPGDEVFVPELATKSVSCSTGTSHLFVVNMPRVKVRVTICDGDDKPIANRRYLIRWEGVEREGRTGADGLVEQPIPANLRLAVLLVWLDDEDREPDLEYTLLLGHLDPIDTLTGVLARLHNLGYCCSTSAKMTDDETLAAVRAFRNDHGLDAGDEIDDAFRGRLSVEHDGG